MVPVPQFENQWHRHFFVNVIWYLKIWHNVLFLQEETDEASFGEATVALLTTVTDNEIAVTHYQPKNISIILEGEVVNSFSILADAFLLMLIRVWMFMMYTVFPIVRGFVQLFYFRGLSNWCFFPRGFTWAHIEHRTLFLDIKTLIFIHLNVFWYVWFTLN